jgi:hypothetical protein
MSDSDDDPLPPALTPEVYARLSIRAHLQSPALVPAAANDLLALLGRPGDFLEGADKRVLNVRDTFTPTSFVLYLFTSPN